MISVIAGICKHVYEFLKRIVLRYVVVRKSERFSFLQADDSFISLIPGIRKHVYAFLVII